MGSMRSVVDYALARRATLKSVLAGRTTVADVCDAHPYLLRAAKFHGEPTEDPARSAGKPGSPTSPTYTGTNSASTRDGSRRARELDEMAPEYGEFQVYVVEVCQSCGWNHLASSYVLGTGEPRYAGGGVRGLASERARYGR